MFRLGELRVCSGNAFQSRTTECTKGVETRVLCNVCRSEALCKGSVDSLPTVAGTSDVR